MLQIAKSVLGSTEEEIFNILSGMVSSDNSKYLNDFEKNILLYLVGQYKSIGQFPTEGIFTAQFPDYKRSLEEKKAMPLNDLIYYIKQFKDNHLKAYQAMLISKSSMKVRSDGITPDLVEALRAEIKSEEVETALDFEQYYNNKIITQGNKGVKTFVREIDESIDSIKKGQVCTLAGWTGSFKCVSEKERIFTSNGLMTIKDIFNKTPKFVLAESGLDEVIDVHDEGVKDSIIVFIDGRSVEVSPVHKFKVFRNGTLQWVEAKDLIISDKIAVRLEDDYVGRLNKDLEYCYISGLLISKGITIQDNEVCISVASRLEIQKDIGNLLKKVGTLTNKVITGNTITYRLTVNEDLTDSIKNHKIPLEVWSYSRESMCEFISGVSDACIDVKNNGHLQLVHSNYELLNDLSRILVLFDILPTIKEVDKSYHLIIKDTLSIIHYTNNFNINDFSLRAKLKSVNNKSRKLYGVSSEIKKIFKTLDSNTQNSFKDFLHQGNLSDQISFRNVYGRIGKYLKNSEYLEYIYNNHIVFQEVTNLKYGKCYMYDLTVKNSHTYCLSGCITHNTTWAGNIAVKNAREGVNIVYISLEVAEHDLLCDFLSLFSRDKVFKGHAPLERHKIRNGKLNAEERDYLFKVVYPEYQKLIAPNLHIVDESKFNRFSESEIVDILYKYDDEKPVDAIFFDHANLFKFYSDKGNNTSTGEVINKYVSFIRKLSICFRKKDGEAKQVASVLLAQTNRTGWKKADHNFRQTDQKNKKGVPKEGYDLTALAEANELERCSSLVLAVYTNDALQSNHTAYVQVLKTRYGELNQTPVGVECIGEYFSFGEEAEIKESAFNMDSIDDLINLDLGDSLGDVGTSVNNDLDFDDVF